MGNLGVVVENSRQQIQSGVAKQYSMKVNTVKFGKGQVRRLGSKASKLHGVWERPRVLLSCVTLNWVE